MSTIPLYHLLGIHLVTEGLLVSISQQLGKLMLPIIQPVAEYLVQLFERPAQTHPLDIIRFIVIIPTLIIAVYYDLHTRRIANRVWIPMLSIGLALLGLQIIDGNTLRLAPWMLANILFGTGTAYLLYRFGIFGGADFKALTSISILFPVYPYLTVFPLYLPPVAPEPLNIVNLFSLTILSNTALVSAAYPLYLLYINRDELNTVDSALLSCTTKRGTIQDSIDAYGMIIPTWNQQLDEQPFFKRLQTVFGFIRTGVDSQFIQEYADWHNKHVNPVDTITDIDTPYIEQFLQSDANTLESGEQKWRPDETIDASQTYMKTLLNQDQIRYSPGIPFLVPISIGVITALTIGDIMYLLVL